MKTLILLIAAIALTANGFSQNDKVTEALFKTPNIVIQEITTQHGEGVQTAQSALVFGEENDFEKFWKKFAKSNYAVDGKRESGYYASTNFVSPKLSPDSLSFYYKVEKDGDFCRITSLTKQKGAYLSSGATYENVRAMMEKGIYEYYVSLYDEKISVLQKNYDRQVKDAEKLEKQGERLQRDKDDHEKSINKLNGDISSLRSSMDKTNSDKKALDNEVEILKRELEQQKKEIKRAEDDLKVAELDYNTKLAAGDLSEKKAEKGLKDITKRRESISKLQGKLTDKNTKVTETENKLINADRKLSETQNNLEKKEAEVSNHRSDIERLNKEINANKDNINEEKLQVENAKGDLEKLKMAKGGLTILQ
ncbi:MAG: hypothetical protein R2809_02765 [Flavobacteriales bacterium]